MATFIICVIIGLVIYAIINKSGKVKPERYTTLIDILNEVAFSGKGKITMINNNTFKLYDGMSNQIIIFYYENAIKYLTITWKYKYWQREVVFERKFDTTEDQTDFADQLIDDFAEVVAKHKAKVDKYVDKNAIMEEVLNEIRYM